MINNKHHAKRLRILACLLLTFSICSCSSVRNRSAQQEPVGLSSQSNWLASGSIVLASPVPDVSSAATRRMLGFLPAGVVDQGRWLLIDTQSGQIKLMEGEKNLYAVEIKAADKIEPGTYELLHKQRHALWHAPDEYFEKRNMEVPPEGDRSRFMRGALGEFVLFIDKNTPIHDGPIWSEEVGGLQVTESDISRIYYKLDVGSVIEVE